MGRTAASGPHTCWLLGLLQSLAKFHPDLRVVVYDLAPKGSQQIDPALLACARPPHDDKVALRQFPYDQYPPWFDVRRAAGEYAWKPVIIKKLVDEFGKVLWLDSGNAVKKRNNLTEVLKVLDSTGFYSPASRATADIWSHPAAAARLAPSADLSAIANCNGAFIGFNRDSKAYHTVLVPWYQCALDRACIAPPGSNRTNHRQDQTALTLIAYRAGLGCAPLCIAGCGGVLLHQDGRAALHNWCRTLGFWDFVQPELQIDPTKANNGADDMAFTTASSAATGARRTLAVESNASKSDSEDSGMTLALIITGVVAALVVGVAIAVAASTMRTR